MTSRKVDTGWFTALIEKKHDSMRQMALKMTNTMGGQGDIARLSRVLNGKVEPTVVEVIQIADLLDSKVMEVLRRLGYRL